MDVHNEVQRSKNMSAIRSKGTKIEVILGKLMWAKGFRYRKNDKTVFGTPDFTFKGLKMAIFVDSEYFHGKDWETEKYRIKSNVEFWHKKIEQNIQRDLRVNEELLKNRWKVLRFWGQDVKKNPEFCIDEISKAIESQKSDKVLRDKGKIQNSG
ncbi:MAG: very short patch repair endonuclease [Bacteroidales bacterium]|nr:very short patch repair endonuclease [Bacteroidales bacterium]